MSRGAELHDPVNHQGPASQDIQKRCAVGVGLRACQAAGQEGLGDEASMQRATGNGQRATGNGYAKRNGGRGAVNSFGGQRGATFGFVFATPMAYGSIR